MPAISKKPFQSFSKLKIFLVSTRVPVIGAAAISKETCMETC